jgi:hypothetical protein
MKMIIFTKKKDRENDVFFIYWKLEIINNIGENTCNYRSWWILQMYKVRGSW